MEILSRAFAKMRRDGIVAFCIFVWFRVFSKVEKHVPQSFYWVAVQVQWAPFLTLITKHSFTDSEENVWCARKLGRKNFYFPLLEHHRTAKNAYIPNKERKYSYEDFVQVSEGDVVFDIGAFVGGYSIAVSDRADFVVAIEPNPISARCLAENTPANVRVRNAGAYDESGNMELKLGYDRSQDSLIEPDTGKAGSVMVPTETIAEIAASNDLDRINMLKVEAEGVEPEIIDGIGDIDVKKVSVDAGPERYGDDVIDEVTQILKDDNCQVRVKGDYVYARCDC